MRTFQTFEEWFQSDLKRMRNRTRWNYPQVPVYETVYERSVPRGTHQQTMDSYAIMSVKFSDTGEEVRERINNEGYA